MDPYTGDISLDPWTAFYDSVTGIYDNIVKDYVEDIYEDVIEGYTLATVKVSIFRNYLMVGKKNV